MYKNIYPITCKFLGATEELSIQAAETRSITGTFVGYFKVVIGI